MKYVTVVFELEDDKRPPYNIFDEVDGGCVTAISLGNELKRNYLIEQAVESGLNDLEIVIRQILEAVDVDDKQLSDFVEEEW